MITHVSLVTVWVTDQEAAKAFYVDKLGFAEATDVTMGDGYRWLTLCHPDHPELELTLMKPGPPLDDEAAAFSAGCSTRAPWAPSAWPQTTATRRMNCCSQGRRVHPGADRPALQRRGHPARQLGQLAGPGGAQAVHRREHAGDLAVTCVGGDQRVRHSGRIGIGEFCRILR